MQLKTTLKDIENSYPSEIKIIRSKHRRSQSREAAHSLYEFEFFYLYEELEDTYTFQERDQGIPAKDYLEYSRMSLEEKLKHHLDRLSVRIRAQKGRCRFDTDLLTKIPKQIEEEYRRMLGAVEKLEHTTKI